VKICVSDMYYGNVSPVIALHLYDVVHAKTNQIACSKSRLVEISVVSSCLLVIDGKISKRLITLFCYVSLYVGLLYSKVL
jgi:hypothetical protein